MAKWSTILKIRILNGIILFFWFYNVLKDSPIMFRLSRTLRIY